MRKYDRLTWIVLGVVLCLVLYLVSYHPLRAAQLRIPVLNQPLVQKAFEPARRVAECESLDRPMQCWARVWGQGMRCRPSLKNLQLALDQYTAAYAPTPISEAGTVPGPGQYPPID